MVLGKLINGCHPMNLMSTLYEHELRHVLMGEEKGVEKIIKSCSAIEKIRMRSVLNKPFMVVRAAGSGSFGTGDLLVLRGDICFPIEVKSSAKDKQYFSGRTWDQYEALRTEGERCGLMPLYAYRLKGVRGDSWRLFRVQTSNVAGPLRALERAIPSLPLSKTGKPFLDWKQGMPLNTFLGIACHDPHKPLSNIIERASENNTKSNEAPQTNVQQSSKEESQLVKGKNPFCETGKKSAAKSKIKSGYYPARSKTLGEATLEAFLKGHTIE